jgi:predicted nuclease with RNAse H fold
MATGFAAYEALAETGTPVLEVYPYSGFRELARGARLPRKTTAAGKRARAKILATAGTDAKRLRLSHHDVDALLAAVVARDYAQGRARQVGCSHDDSAIWLPAPAASADTVIKQAPEQESRDRRRRAPSARRM